MDIQMVYKGDFSRTDKFLNNIKKFHAMILCDRAGKEGVKALEEATPKKSGTTSKCWYYEVEETKEGFVVRWNNSNIKEGQNIAVLLQRGHGTRNGGYVQGTDYINPALKDVFEGIAKRAYAELIGGAVNHVI